MSNIGIFFGTDTGRTRLLAKQIAKKLGALAAAPINIGRCTTAEFLAFDRWILGSPTLGEGELPGCSTGLAQPSWEEFLPKLDGCDLSGKVFAVYGLGDQQKYPREFVDAIGIIHDALVEKGARPTGYWPSHGYHFSASRACEGERFVGLPLDQHNQGLLTEPRIDAWLVQVLLEMDEQAIPGGE